MTSTQRIAAFSRLGKFLQQKDEELESLIQSAKQYNGWFTPENTAKAVEAIASMLDENGLKTWLEQWQHLDKNQKQLKVGLILAGNIPLVGFHDVLSVLAAGHIALIKFSSQDKQLLPYILKKLVEIEPAFAEQIEYVERLTDFDAVIATGSTNSSRYFEYYFSQVPHIIRKNRNSVAVITGNESAEELHTLGSDIFDYFGLGCRNVSKLFVPKGYIFNGFFESIESYNTIAQHHKYVNNYDYNKSIYLVNGAQHLDNGFLLLKEDEKMASPLAVLYYEEYESITELEQKLTDDTEQIQCVASMQALNIQNQVVPFSFTQQPQLWDYADGVDLMQFLLSETYTIPGK